MFYKHHSSVMIAIVVEYYDEDEAYGHSFDDNYCISPGTGRYQHCVYLMIIDDNEGVILLISP